MVTETVLLSALTIGAGLLSGLFAICYKSKCTDISCCCFKVHRDVSVEEEEDAAAAAAATATVQ